MENLKYIKNEILTDGCKKPYTVVGGSSLPVTGIY